MERDDDYLSIQGAAEAFKVPRQKIYRWIQAGKLDVYRSALDAREKLVRREDVAKLLRPVKITR
jgi:excisionase family DNA binding protein